MITAIDYDNYRKGVMKHLSFIYGLDSYTAEDIFQDSFESFINSLDTINERGYDKVQVYGWVKAIARNMYLRQFSAKNRSKSKYTDKFVNFGDIDALCETMDSEVDSFKDTNDFKHDSYVKPDTDLIEQDFMAIVNKLPSNHRELYLAYIAGHTMDEISRMYHISYGVLAVTINRIKKKIKTHLIKEGLYNG